MAEEKFITQTDNPDFVAEVRQTRRLDHLGTVYRDVIVVDIDTVGGEKQVWGFRGVPEDDQPSETA